MPSTSTPGRPPAPGKAIKVGTAPVAIAITPNGKTAYVASLSDTVTPIRTATNKPGKAIRVSTYPRYIAITPDGRTVYVFSPQAGTVTPIRTATNTALKPIKVPAGDEQPSAMAITPAPRRARR